MYVNQNSSNRLAANKTTTHTRRVFIDGQLANTVAYQLLVFGIVLITNMLTGPAASASEIYIYENQYGEKLFADRPLQKPGYRLIRRQGTHNAKEVPASSHTTSGVQTKVSRKKMPFPERAKRYDHFITWAARSYRLDPALIKAVIHAESAFDPNATSRVGAQGLMQLMPATARSNGVTNSYNPEQNIMGGSKYLRYLMDKYNGDLSMVLAAYNAGEGRVTQYNGIPPFKETQNYVKKVIRLHQKYAEMRDA